MTKKLLLLAAFGLFPMTAEAQVANYGSGVYIGPGPVTPVQIDVTRYEPLFATYGWLHPLHLAPHPPNPSPYIFIRTQNGWRRLLMPHNSIPGVYWVER